MQYLILLWQSMCSVHNLTSSPTTTNKEAAWQTQLTFIPSLTKISEVTTLKPLRVTRCWVIKKTWIRVLVFTFFFFTFHIVCKNLQVSDILNAHSVCWMKSCDSKKEMLWKLQFYAKWHFFLKSASNLVRIYQLKQNGGKYWNNLPCC